MRSSSLFAAILIPAALAQNPVIQSVVNGASKVPVRAVAPQMWVSIEGQNLAASVASSSDVVLPLEIGGTSVTFNGIAGALNYVSPTQINVQVPGAMNTARAADVVVKTPAGASAPVTVPVIVSVADEYTRPALGIFTQDPSGCGQAFAYNLHADGSVELNTPSTSLDPSSDIGLEILATGLGYFPDRKDGVPWQFNPDDNVHIFFFNNVKSVFLGMPGVFDYNMELVWNYIGPAPGTVGVDQMNAITISSPHSPAIPEGCRIPLYATSGIGPASQFVNVSIHTGGGSCVDPPASGLMNVAYEKTFMSDATGTSVSENVSVRIEQAPHIAFPSLPPAFSDFESGLLQPASFCAASYPRTFDIGPLTLTGPGIAGLALKPQTSAGITTYRAPAPGIALPAGSYTLTGAGGEISGPQATFVGPVSATAQIPPPIVITTNLAPGTKVSATDVTIHWTGGDNSSVVSVQLMSGGLTYAIETVPASQGIIRYLRGMYFGPFPTDPLFSFSPDLEFIVTQLPAVSMAFSVPGLTLGGQQSWKYVYDFRGLVDPF